MARSPSRPRKKPRISANELALYMESSETARVGIIQRAAERPAYTVTRYQDARDAICTYPADLARNIKPLVAAEQILSSRASDPAERSLRQKDAKLSIEVLHAMQGMHNSVAPFSFSPAPKRQKKLMISGVEVSVHADLLVLGVGRDSDKNRSSRAQNDEGRCGIVDRERKKETHRAVCCNVS